MSDLDKLNNKIGQIIDGIKKGREHMRATLPETDGLYEPFANVREVKYTQAPGITKNEESTGQDNGPKR